MEEFATVTWTAQRTGNQLKSSRVEEGIWVDGFSCGHYDTRYGDKTGIV